MKNHTKIVYNISYKNSIDAKALRFRFNKIDGFLRVSDRTRYLVLFGSGKYDYYYKITTTVIYF